MVRTDFVCPSTSELLTNYKFLGPYNSELALKFFEGIDKSTLTHAPYLKDTWFPVPCRKCRACRKLKSLDWSSRCVVEMKSHTVNSFITLTYDNASLPLSPSGLPTLRHSDFQAFMKRYRRHLSRRGLSPIRFYMCGEYGPKLGRPHYHSIIFGHCFSDLVRVPHMEHGHEVFFSPTLQKLWRHGYVTIGQATPASARYVASYVHKKMLGPLAPDYYQDRLPEYNRPSVRKAIGLEWLETYWADILNFDEFVLDGRRVPIPEYFSRKLLEMFPDEMLRNKAARSLNGLDRLRNVVSNGGSDLANRERDGRFLDIIHHNSFRRRYETS